LVGAFFVALQIQLKRISKCFSHSDGLRPISLSNFLLSFVRSYKQKKMNFARRHHN
jgi:hypothetical protein